MTDPQADTGAVPLDQLPRVKIVRRDHPHHGEYGRFTGEVVQPKWGGAPMALVKLENCVHGTGACYVSKGDVRQVNDDDQYI